MSWQDHLDSDPQRCHGSVCVKGTRVLASVLIDSVASGEPIDAVAAAYRVSAQDVQAALRYAAELARDEVITFPDVAA